ncbi:hypothetical protein FEM48_Zijuj08G0003200 [Ziziphus jujuba var. spinosa]|uniref:Uncharacterized protein n=1 Tax=Ziziphus jujuba var. spinosa TaxID=714518 RepID=A0A978UVW4_ZIZJJ|nr:hypothetical protein FEM48_Zijuj08G0003200 [Ziziphus jujuba var. spinosa]
MPTIFSASSLALKCTIPSILALNKAAFPGTQTRVVTHGKYKKLDNGIYYKDICTGTGPHPKNDKGDAFTSFYVGGL